MRPRISAADMGPFATARISLGESSVVECVRTLRADERQVVLV
jgi:hypothetical protein